MEGQGQWSYHVKMPHGMYENHIKTNRKPLNLLNSTFSMPHRGPGKQKKKPYVVKS